MEIFVVEVKELKAMSHYYRFALVYFLPELASAGDKFSSNLNFSCIFLISSPPIVFCSLGEGMVESAISASIS